MKSLVKNLSKIFLVLIIALQPLHSYSIIYYQSESSSIIGVEHLSAEMCGSKYNNELSVNQTVSILLDNINELVLTEITTDCVCCESLDTASIEKHINHANFLFYLSVINGYSFPKDQFSRYDDNLISTNYSRAPPAV